MSLMTNRFAAVEETIAQVRAAEARHGVGQAALTEIKSALISPRTSSSFRERFRVSPK